MYTHTPESGSNNHVDAFPKTCSSERGLQQVAAAVIILEDHTMIMIPFNKSFPSKWDDAERWITSPIPGNPQPRIRPMPKSGPVMHAHKGGTSFTVGSPLLKPNHGGVSVCYDGANSDPSNGKSGGLSDMLCETSLSDDNVKEEEESLIVSRDVVSRRDVATQMSPEAAASAPHSSSSSKDRHSFSALPFNASKDHQVRVVRIDESATVAAMQSMKKQKGSNKGSPWNASKAFNNTTRLQREEAKITSWENLQKAKAEAAIRKLEMELEKKRCACMDKIMNKLRTSQMKAQTMRDLLTDQSSTSKIGAYVKACSLSSCFFSHRS